MQKLYCYVDESGQDTKGEMFIVALVLSFDQRDALQEALEKIEAASGKWLKKWTKTTLMERIAYMERVIRNPLFEDTWFYRHHTKTILYEEHLVETIVAGIKNQVGTRKDYKAVVLVDALGKVERFRVTLELRRQGIQVDKVRGPRDESDAVIRLADAIAGLVRDAAEYKEYAKKLCKEAQQKGVFIGMP